MSRYYPEIDEEALLLMIELQKEDPNYIFGGHFPAPIEELFKGLHAVQGVLMVADEPDLDGMTKWEKLEHESNELFSALTEAGKGIKDRDNAERMSYFRTATQLLERIVGIQERALNVKKLAEFQQIVLSIMDDVLDGDQRTAVRKRLEDAARGE